ncbi:MAG: prepilin-type N-terminal cleavage/methylation domain-containing protein [bacterium]
MKNPRAFTLIELLIVVAIIGILAAIAIPNFMNARIRANIARVQSDLRTAQIAVDMYQVDNGSFPWTDGVTLFFGPYPNPYWVPLTTPIAYFTAVPLDPFGDDPNDPRPAEPFPWSLFEYPDYAFRCSRYIDPAPSDFNYFWPEITLFAHRISEELGRTIITPRSGAYMISSQGPDRIPYSERRLFYDVETAILYDTTNGLNSPGDIVRLGPGGLSFE